jgi:APA family basic amino acid/polyamine antiporter
LWAFLGLESATIPAEDVKDPTRTIPRATVLGTLFSAVIYILGTVAVMGIIPPSALANSTAPFADAANSIWGSWAGYAVAAGAAISSFGALNGWILLSGQIPLAIARDNLFPAKFGRLSKRGTPVFGLVVSSVLVTVIMMMNYTKNLVEQFTFILLLSTLTALLLYAFSTMAELMISIKEREKFSNGRLLKTIVISVLAFLYTMWAIAGAGQEIVYWGFLLIMSGVPVYVWMQWRNA